MGRKKATNPDDNLTEIIMLRISESTWRRLEKIRLNSNCQTIPEVIRRIIEKQKIIYYHKDASMDAPMEIMTAIQKELKAIGVNVNQVTRHFHNSTTDGQRLHHLQNMLQFYKQVDAKVSFLLSIISQLAKKWLQK